MPKASAAEGAVGGGVRVAADDRHARLGHAEFGADHVDDALILVSPGKSVMPNSAAVLVERFELASRDRDRRRASRADRSARCDRP